MLRPHPTSLNTVSYNGVIRMLETIRDVKPEREAPIVHHVYVDTGSSTPPFISISLSSNLHGLVSDRHSRRSRVL
jgi:hypothetical protein